MSDPKTARIRELNDAFRRTFAGGKVVMTAGVDALPDMVKAAALQKAATFDAVHRGQRSARRARLRQLRAVRSQVLLENRLLRPRHGVRERGPERPRANHPRHDRHARLGVLTMRAKRKRSPHLRARRLHGRAHGTGAGTTAARRASATCTR